MPSVRSRTLRTAFARVGDRLQSLPAAQIRMHHVALYRSGPNDRHFYHEIVERTWFEPRQHAHLRARFDLKHADAVAALQHLVRQRIFGRNVVDGEFDAVKVIQQIDRFPNRRQHAETEYVDFQQSECFQIVFVPLNHRAFFHRRIFDRHQLSKWPA